MRMIRPILTALMVALACVATPALAQKPDQVWGYSDQDAQMNAAIEQARAHYPMFIAELHGAPPSSFGAFGVKVGLTQSSGGQEHIWVGNLRFEGEDLVGELLNEPVGLPGMRRGSRVVVRDGDVSDWSIDTPQGQYGSFTTRVMLPSLDPELAAQMRAHLAPSPLPPHWSS
ncbi:MAG: DUF2314 domain-containing protein [Hyphomonadaceae bacterium]|nr:DUF2314 domain-containing protein [Hyphomonadaceae bacterium]